MTRAAALLLALAAGALPAAAQDDPPNPDTIKLVSMSADGSTLHVTLSSAPGFHVYTADPAAKARTDFSFEGGATVAGKIAEPAPKDHQGFLGHEGEVRFSIPIAAPPGTPAGPYALKGRIRGSVCDDNSCTPFSFPISATLQVPAAAPTPAPAPAPGEPDLATKKAEENLAKAGLLGFLVAAMGWGLFSLVQPCVYPLIPITLTFFVKQAGQSRSTGIALSSVYAFGIILSFTGLGLLLTWILGARGAQLFGANPWVNLSIAILFLVFAVSMFGVFALELPQSWTAKLQGGGPRKGMGGAFVLGLLFSVVTFTCTIPFASNIFILAAGSTQKMAGVLAMLTYSTTMALPFFLLGFFPSLIKEVPKSGGWLHTVKVTGGFLELALATQYLANADLGFKWGVISRQVVLVVWVAVTLFTALYLLGIYRMKDDSPAEELGFVRLMSALAFGFLAVYCLGGVFGRPTPLLDFALPPDLNAPVAAGKDGPALKHYKTLREAEEEARKSRRPIFVEYTGAQ